MSSPAQALWHLDAQTSQIQAESLGESKKGLIEVQSICSLVSSGTETLVSRGFVPPALYKQMAVPFMAGSLALPVKYGYSLVGEVISDESPLAGKRIHMLHPHQDRLRVDPEAVFLIPDEIPSPRASLASNLETAVNAIWDSGVSIGDSCLVVGFGLIGSLVARLLQLSPGVEVMIAEVDPLRIQMAQDMGFQVSKPEALTGGMDCAFHCSAQAAGLQTAIDQVGFEGKIIELSWYGLKQVDIQLGGDFHSQRKQLISSQVSHLPADRRGRWDYHRRKEVVFRLLAQEVFDQHIGEHIPFSESPTLFDQLRAGKARSLSYCLTY